MISQLFSALKSTFLEEEKNKIEEFGGKVHLFLNLHTYTAIKNKNCLLKLGSKLFCLNIIDLY